MDAQETGSEHLKIPKPGMKHFGMAGGIIAAIYMLAPVKSFFFTREEGAANTARIEKLEQLQQKMSDRMMEIPTRSELTDALNKSTDRIITLMSGRDERIDQRMNAFEQTVDRRLNLLMQDRNNNNRGK